MLQIASEVLRNPEDNTEVRYSVSPPSWREGRWLVCRPLFLLLGRTEECDKPEVQYPTIPVCQAGVTHNMC